MRNILIENYTLPPVDEKEVLRYAGVQGEGEAFLPLVLECEKECAPTLSPKVCYVELSIEEVFALIPTAKESEGVKRFLGDTKKVVLFAATVGLGVDRRIARYAQVAPSKAMFFQAFGAERIECLCDCFCQKHGLGRRYSPGYGDFPLSSQREIFEVLRCDKIGLTLTESMMLSPTKSVTAIALVGEEKNTCANCAKKDCVYRV